MDDKAPKTQEEIMDWMMKYLEGTQPELTARGFIMQDMYECGGFDNWIDLNPAVIIDSFYEVTSEVSEELMNDLQTAINQEDDLDRLGIDQSMRVDLKGLTAAIRSGMLDIFKSMQIYFDVKRQAETFYGD